MVVIAAAYHEWIQSDGEERARTNVEERERILRLLRTKLSDHSKDSLREGITEVDVRNAIVKTNREKAPGLDGILIELWKSLDDQYRDAVKRDEPETRCNIVWVLTQVYKDIENHGVDPTAGFSEGCMTLIYKKKNPDDIANYWPIMLLNTDYKVSTKAILMKLAEAMPDIIHRDQVGFMSGQSIFDQVKTSKLVIDYMERMNRKGVIVALNQEKVYDKVIHPYLWAVLRKLEFPENFINTVATLYDGAMTAVMINGELSPSYRVTRGVRQGDPLSCLLFNSVIEPLAEYIWRMNTLEGIPIPRRQEYLK